MIESLYPDGLWLYLLRFLCGSSILLLTVLLLERWKLVQNNYRLRARLWKTALLCCVLLLVPINNPFAPNFQIAQSQSAENVLSIVDSNAITPIDSAARVATQYVNHEWDSVYPTPRHLDRGVENRERADDSLARNISLNARESWFDLSSWLILGWASISVLLLLRQLAGSIEGLRQLGVRVPVEPDDRRFAAMQDLCQKLKIDHIPSLTLSQYLSSPTTVLGNEICLPAWTGTELSQEELQVLLAHEIGHIKERHLHFILGMCILSSLFFFQPLFLIAKHRLQDIFEFLADEFAAETSSHSAVARSLASCATKVHSQKYHPWGFAMADGTSRLKQRLQILMLDSTSSARLPVGIHRFATFGILSFFVLGVPSFNYAYVLETVKSAPTQLPTLTRSPIVESTTIPIAQIERSPAGGGTLQSIALSPMTSTVESQSISAPSNNTEVHDGLDSPQTGVTGGHQENLEAENTQSSMRSGSAILAQSMAPIDGSPTEFPAIERRYDPSTPLTDLGFEVVDIDIPNTRKHDFPELIEVPESLGLEREGEGSIEVLPESKDKFVTLLNALASQSVAENGVSNQVSVDESVRSSDVADSSEEEYIVIEDLSKSELRAEIRKIEHEYYRVFNLNTEEDRLKVHCGSYRPPGSHLKSHFCEPKFVTEARSENVVDAFFGGVNEYPDDALTDMKREFQALAVHMNELLKEDQYFRELNILLADLKDRFAELS